MLQTSSCVIATNLGEILTSNGIKLVPKQNTLLNELNNAINNNMFNNKDFYDKEYISYIIANSSTGDEVVTKGIKSYNVSAHDTYMDNYINDISELVSGYVAYARNVVNKEINILKEEFEASLNNYKYKEPEDLFNIIYFKLSEIFGSFIITNEISKYNSTNNAYFESLNLDKLLEETFELNKYILVGDEEQDNLIVNLFNTLGKNLCTQYIVEDIKEYNLNINDLLNYYLINYLFYRNLSERADLDLGISVVALRTKAIANREYFGNRLYVTLENYQRDMRLGKVLANNSPISFSYYNERQVTLVIYEESLNKLAEAGLNIEVILGYVSSTNGSNEITVEKLVKDSEEYLNRWKNTRSLYLISLNNSKLGIFKQILSERFTASLNKDDKNADEQEFLASNSSFNLETIGLSNKYINELEVSDTENVNKILLELVANIRFRFTNSYFILKEMSEIMNMDEKIEPMEAALYATIKHITDFLLDQAQIVRV